MNELDLATELAKEAGELLRSRLGSEFSIKNKEGSQNLVTEYDLKSQKIIVEGIQKSFPRHLILSEEGLEELPDGDETLWIIDPLDGTVNFAHGVPMFGISIAIAKNREICSGVVYNPMLDELFVAERGSGAFLGGKKISVTQTTSTSKALFATGFPYNIRENPKNCIETFAEIVSQGIPIRRMGVASLDLSYLAAGRFDAFWEVGLHPWDMAAGKIMIEEAGGRVSHYDGSTHKIFGYLPILATNGHLHETMVSYLHDH